MNNILITGGAGFIGSNFINLIINNSLIDYHTIVNVDKLTYAANINNINVSHNKNYHFINDVINDTSLISSVLNDFDINMIVNFAAETHVDNSLVNPKIFLETNILGTANLLNCAKNY
jgi:dTDP-glucose 4,6-dehydratase